MFREKKNSMEKLFLGGRNSCWFLLLQIHGAFDQLLHKVTPFEACVFLLISINRSFRSTSDIKNIYNW